MLTGIGNLHAMLLVTNLATFECATGTGPWGTLVLGDDGNYYGTALYGGSDNLAFCHGVATGTIFQMAPSGSVTKVTDFYSELLNGPTGLLKGMNGVWYGTTIGNEPIDCGAIFRISASNIVTSLFTFGETNGCWPTAGLVRGLDGSLYGTTERGGHGYGTIFRLSSETNFVSLHQFDLTNGAWPGYLTVAPDGYLYGSTGAGGVYSDPSHTNGFGTVYRISTNGTFTSLASFDGTNGAALWGPMTLDDSGTLYGTTTAGKYAGVNGTVFKLSPNGDLTVLHYFNGDEDGRFCRSGLIRGADHQFYGMTSEGGPAGFGTLFRISSDGHFTTLATNTSRCSGYRLTFGSDGRLYASAHDSGPLYYGSILRFSIPMVPGIQSIQRVGDSIALSWSSVADQSYQLQYSTSFGSTNWNDLGSAVLATNGTTTANDVLDSSISRFYRVMLLP